eukprot:XP_001708482.1 Hypothetical protein GL50803_36709 [Giardia lamblia ATCC 50803]
MVSYTPFSFCKESYGIYATIRYRINESSPTKAIFYTAFQV